MREPSELRFGVVRGLGRGSAVSDGGPHRARGRGGFGGFCSPMFTIAGSNGAASSACCVIDFYSTRKGPWVTLYYSASCLDSLRGVGGATRPARHHLSVAVLLLLATHWRREAYVFAQ